MNLTPNHDIIPNALSPHLICTCFSIPGSVPVPPNQAGLVHPSNIRNVFAAASMPLAFPCPAAATAAPTAVSVFESWKCSLCFITDSSKSVSGSGASKPVGCPCSRPARLRGAGLGAHQGLAVPAGVPEAGPLPLGEFQIRV